MRAEQSGRRPTAPCDRPVAGRRTGSYTSGQWCTARALMVTGGLIGLATGIGAVVARGPSNYLEAGFSFPGRLTSVAAAALRILADTAGSVTVGALAFAVICTAPTAAGRIGVDGYAAVTLARRLAPVWCLAALLAAPVSAADVVGQPIARLATSGHLWSVIGQTLPSRGWLVAGLLTLPVVAATRSVLSWTGVTGLALWSGLALLPPAVVGNAGEGLGHDVDTTAAVMHMLATAVWLGAAVAAVAQLRRRHGDHRQLLRRFGWLSGMCCAALAMSGAAMAANLVGAGQWTTTQYGLLALAKAATVVVLGAAVCLLSVGLAGWVSAGRPGRAGLVLAGEAALLLAATGAATGMAQQPAAAFLVTNPTPSQQQIGYSLPRPPGLATLAGIWRFDLLLGTVSVLLAVLYFAGVIRLRHAGQRWPLGRSVMFASGCGCLLLVSSSGIAAYAEATFSMHMVAHMALNMLIPALLVLGGPRTLLEACDRSGTPRRSPPWRDYADWIVRSWPVRLLTNPFGAVTVFAALLFGIYLTPIFGYAVGYHWGHELMSIAFLVSGYFLFWQIVGIDRLPHRLPHLARLGTLVALMPIHAIFGVAILTRQSVMGLVFYGYLSLPWLPDQLADQRLGALIVWIGGELPLLAIAVVLMIQWWQSGSGASGGTGGCTCR